MRLKKRPVVLLSLALGGCHFLASLLIVPLTLRVGEHIASASGPNALLSGLHLLTRILYYPLLGLALYPRHWFPGPWIAIPILVNSVLWGILLAVVARLVLRYGSGK